MYLNSYKKGFFFYCKESNYYVNELGLSFGFYSEPYNEYKQIEFKLSLILFVIGIGYRNEETIPF